MRRALAAVGAVVLFVMGVPGTAAAADADGFVHFTVPAHATAAELWVEVESPALGAADVVIEVDGTEHTPVDTPIGVTLVVPASGSAQDVAVAIRRASDPDIALTVIDADGTILHSQHERVSSADPGGGTPTPDPSASATPAPSASATAGPTTGSPAGGGDEGGALATTGTDAGVAGWAALVAAVMAIALGVALVARRAVRTVGDVAVTERNSR